MKKVFIALILAQIVIITYLLIQIYQKTPTDSRSVGIKSNTKGDS